MIEVFQTNLPGVLKIRRKVSEDLRGVYAEIYRRKDYFDSGIIVDFEKGEDDASTSKKGSLRGLHGDERTYKLVCCTFGELLLVVVNYDETSDYFGKWEAFALTDRNGLQVLIPPKHLNGHLILSERGGTFHYKQSACYSGAENQWSVRWNDRRFKISWPITNPILSVRDGGRRL